MHGWISPDDTTVVNHNGDYSGNVIIRRYGPSGGESLAKIDVPFEHLKQFFLEYLRERKVSQLEQSEYSDLEGLLFK